MNLQKLRVEAGLSQPVLANKVSISVPMLSNFENYKCLPIPKTLQEICAVLDCGVLDLYDRDEIYILQKRKRTEQQGPKTYKLTVTLPNNLRILLTQKNLELCGFTSLKDFIMECCRKFEQKLEAIKTKTTKQSECLMDENGIYTTISHH